MIGLTLGVLTGLFLGEYCAPLKVIGDAFIALLQMTVLPYITLALIANIGSLTATQAKRLSIYGALVLLVLWAIGVVVVSAMPFAFPDLKTASFFSTSMLEPRESIDYLKLYIPSNPFASMANNLIPAVVLFSIAIGIALIGMAEKTRLIEPLTVLITALTRVNKFVVTLTPIGVFALSASAAGTLTLEQLGRLQAYFLTYVAAALLLTFWVLPVFVASLTPFAALDVIRLSRDALVTAFATGNVFVVLPLLVRDAEAIFDRFGLKDEAATSSIDVVLPVSFPFPGLGRILTLLFVPFAAWFAGHDLALTQYPMFMVSGLISYFGSLTLAMPFLLDLMRIPADLFRLFLLSGIFCERFTALLGAMHILCFTLVTTCAVTRGVSLQRKRALLYASLTMVIFSLVIVTARVYLGYSTKGAYTKDQIIAQMQLLDTSTPAVVLGQAVPNPVSLRPAESRLDRIRERGVIRIGFRPDALPFSYFNDQGELVGLDIELAHRLGRSLGVRIEFVPVRLETIAQQLADDHCDLVMSGVPGSVSRYEEILFTDPYLDIAPALVVRDHLRRRFSSREKILAMDDLKLGVMGDRHIEERVQSAFPNAEISPIESPRAFFEGQRPDLAAMVTSAEGGSAWTLLYPDFATVPLVLGLRKWPLGYPVGGADLELWAFLNNWIDLKKKEGAIQTAYDHWILGRTAWQKRPRWSIIRDVLRWVD